MAFSQKRVLASLGIIGRSLLARIRSDNVPMDICYRRWN